jgi:MFS family permease
MSGSSDNAEYPVPTIIGSLIAGVFFGGVGGGVAFPTLPTLGTVLSISPFVVGLILSANRFTRLLINTPAGQIIDRFGARRPMTIGFLLQGLAPFGYIAGLHPSLIPLFGAAAIFILARILWGVGSAFVFVGAYSLVVQVTTSSNRGKWIGYFRGGQSLGFPTGLILGGVLTDIYSYDIAFGVAGGLGLVAMGVAAIVIPDLSVSVEEPATLVELPNIIRADPRIFMIGTVNFTVRFLFAGVLLSTIVLYADVNDISIGAFSAVGVSGIIMAISVLFSGATTVFAGRISDLLENRALLTVPALAVFAFGFGLLGVVPTLIGTLIGVSCIGIGVGGSNPPLLAHLGDISPDKDMGKMGGVYNMFGDLGSSFGPVIALPLADQIGYRAEYIACVGIIAIVSIFVFRTLLSEELPHLSPT